MEITEYCEYIESYCTCPHCENIISNAENCEEEIYPDAIIVCPICSKKFEVK